MVAFSGEIAERGFALLPGVVGAHELDGAAAALERAAAEGGGHAHRGELFAMRNLLRLPEVRDLAGLPGLREAVGAVLGPAAIPVRGLLLEKSAGANWKVGWHQDLTTAVRERVEVPGFRAWSVKDGVPHVRPPTGVLEGMLTLRIHLDDCGPENGPLRVLPGSHSAGIIEPAAVREWRVRIAPVCCVALRGAVLAMRPLLLHASFRAASPQRRRVMHLEFASAVLPGGLEWAGS